ncbi:ribbon-helix-helix protein, CopG family [Acinetobacter baretiae]|uniref:ribbon-helix-helix protein, CopG family n=1 Tax=Acinetobacter baretiae TaxID=2605383 RepID=UPI001BB3B952|nr:ribbon-helix-helix protein, CopG family [Acinetobacter baretiae]
MIAVSLPAELLNKLDCAVAKTGKKRSYLIKESLHMYLNTIEKKQIDKEIILNTSKPFYQILVDEFQNEKKLTTEARKSEFTIFSDDGKLYVINSKGNTRKLDEVYVNEFFEEYKRTGSTSTSSYQAITFNSSYLLSALKYLMENELI